MDNNLNFKFGQYANLPTASANTAGPIFVTTDEQAMYIDLPSASDSTKVGRIRIGDIIVCENLSDLQPPYHEGAFYYVASKNALLRYQPKAFDSDGNPVKDTATGKVVYGWTQINSLTSVQQAIENLQAEVDALGDTDDEILEAMNLLLPTDTFTEFQEQYANDLETISGTISDTAEAIRGEIAAEVEEINAAIEGAKEAYEAADANLQDQINDKVDTDTYTTKIGEIEENISDLNTSLSDTAEAIRGEIAAEVEELDAAIEGVKEAYAAADEDLQDQINNKVDSDTYATKIGEIEEDISDLSDILDNTAAAIRGEIDTEVKDINAAIDGVKEAYLMRNGDLSITGDLTFETAGTITNIKNPEGNTDAANKLYVDTSISSAIAGVNAMTLKGSVGAEDGLPKASDKPQTGDTYIVSSAKSYITEYDTNGKSKVKVDAKIGDLFINTGADDETPIWVHVASGYNESYLQRFVIGTDTVSGKQLPYIAITDGIDTDTANEEGRIYFEGSSNTNLNFSIAADSNDTTNRNFIVTASLAWGTFDPEPETTEPESGVLPGEPQ